MTQPKHSAEQLFGTLAQTEKSAARLVLIFSEVRSDGLLAGFFLRSLRTNIDGFHLVDFQSPDGWWLSLNTEAVATRDDLVRQVAGHWAFVAHTSAGGGDGD